MFRFSIRDLLWLTVVAAVAVSWFLDRSSLKRPLVDGDIVAIAGESMSALNRGETLVITRSESGVITMKVLPKPSASGQKLPAK